ncbi:MAG: radical SAM protein [Oscillospiraceae bacterium]
MIDLILRRIEKNETLSKNDICTLLSVKTCSHEYYKLLYMANEYSRITFGGRGMIFAQIGIDAQECRINCKFCSLAKGAFDSNKAYIKPLSDTVEQAKELVSCGIDDLFLMTTAEFSQKKFLEYGRAVRAVIPKTMRLVANVGDFDEDYAKKLKMAGFTGAYHICRLGEGIDTAAAPQTRVNTMNVIKSAGLELYYCVEPIGPEHTNEAIATEILRIQDYPVGVMAVMKRCPVKGTELFANGEITAARLAQICAVTTLAARPPRAMCVHEPDELSLMAGANQIYAECGTNPRDLENDTKNGRGFSVEKAKRMLRQTEWM